jgi:hypothetical protein
MISFTVQDSLLNGWALTDPIEGRSTGGCIGARREQEAIGAICAHSASGSPESTVTFRTRRAIAGRPEWLRPKSRDFIGELPDLGGYFYKPQQQTRRTSYRGFDCSDAIFWVGFCPVAHAYDWQRLEHHLALVRLGKNSAPQYKQTGMRLLAAAFRRGLQSSLVDSFGMPRLSLSRNDWLFNEIYDAPVMDRCNWP